MWVKLHRLPNDVGHLVKSAIIHLLHSMQDPPLHRLQTIIDVWHRPLQNYIRSVVQKVFLVHAR